MQHANHPDHDLLLIAAHAAGDLEGAEQARAKALLERCAPSADLHRDLVAIAAATRAVPRLAAAPRDFRLSPEQALRLRRGSWLQTLLAPFGGARSVVRPLAAAFTSLGVAGLLVATLLPGMLGSSVSLAPERDQSVTGIAASAAPAAAPGATAASVPVAGATAAPGAEFGTKDGNATNAPDIAIAGGTGTEAPNGGGDDAGRVAAINPPSPLFIASLALLAVGLLLFGLRYAGRRLR